MFNSYQEVIDDVKNNIKNWGPISNIAKSSHKPAKEEKARKLKKKIMKIKTAICDHVLWISGINSYISYSHLLDLKFLGRVSSF